MRGNGPEPRRVGVITSQGRISVRQDRPVGDTLWQHGVVKRQLSRGRLPAAPFPLDCPQRIPHAAVSQRHLHHGPQHGRRPRPMARDRREGPRFR